jgi:hypothetical protein
MLIARAKAVVLFADGEISIESGIRRQAVDSA